MLPMDTEVVRQIPLSHSNSKDFWAWHYDKRGVFSVRSVYRMIAAVKTQREDWLERRSGHSNIAADKKSWTELWKVKIHQRFVSLFGG